MKIISTYALASTLAGALAISSTVALAAGHHAIGSTGSETGRTSTIGTPPATTTGRTANTSPGVTTGSAPGSTVNNPGPMNPSGNPALPSNISGNPALPSSGD